MSRAGISQPNIEIQSLDKDQNEIEQKPGEQENDENQLLTGRDYQADERLETEAPLMTSVQQIDEDEFIEGEVDFESSPSAKPPIQTPQDQKIQPLEIMIEETQKPNDPKKLRKAQSVRDIFVQKPVAKDEERSDKIDSVFLASAFQ